MENALLLPSGLWNATKSINMFFRTTSNFKHSLDCWKFFSTLKIGQQGHLNLLNVQSLIFFVLLTSSNFWYSVFLFDFVFVVSSFPNSSSGSIDTSWQMKSFINTMFTNYISLYVPVVFSSGKSRIQSMSACSYRCLLFQRFHEQTERSNTHSLA